MAFTFKVEDGSGFSDANAYIDVSFADDYHSGRHPGSQWENATTPNKQAAIVRATDHVDRVFGWRFRGSRQSKTQALEWPRNGAHDDDGYALSGEDEIPRLLKRAVAEYALRALLVGELTPDVPGPVPSQDLSSATSGQSATSAFGRVKSRRRKVGPVETEDEYESIRPGTSDEIPSYPAADRWLTELIHSNNSITLVRA